MDELRSQKKKDLAIQLESDKILNTELQLYLYKIVAKISICVIWMFERYLWGEKEVRRVVREAKRWSVDMHTCTKLSKNEFKWLKSKLCQIIGSLYPYEYSHVLPYLNLANCERCKLFLILLAAWWKQNKCVKDVLELGPKPARTNYSHTLVLAIFVGRLGKEEWGSRG